MSVATPILTMPATLLTAAIDGILQGVSTAIEKGLEEVGNEFSKALSRSSKD